MSILLDFLFPRRCYGCGHPGQYLCSACQSQLFPQPINLIDTSLFEGNLSLFKYNGLITNLIHDYKYNFVSDLAGQLSGLISSTLKSSYPNLLKYWQNNLFTLIPIPLHPFRQKWRGYNQSDLICQHLSRQIKLNYSNNLLSRSVNTSPQVKNEKPSDRQANLSNVFNINETNTNPGENFILVDDVATTFSTLRSARHAFTCQINSCHLVKKFWTLTIAG
ncbi:MAG: double zinc ribbon domain-containing protein [Candidatus Shapirobacteria bacterium]|jgi:ComF family protein